jgi:hypothetical protein
MKKKSSVKISQLCIERQCCVVIPIYKENPLQTELLALEQCVKILNKYPIIFVTHNYLICSAYENICNKYHITIAYEYFSSFYFKNISGYNALMLSTKFYRRFAIYNYILVYQLDAYIFSDQLEFWCKKNYDYIGAPFFSKSDDGSPIFGNNWGAGSLVFIGNGGLSLRKTQTFINVCSHTLQIMSFFYLLDVVHHVINIKQKNIIYKILSYLVKRLKNKLRLFCYPINEDVAFARIFLNYGKIPPITEAIQFSFDNYPEYLYDINKKTLPFGCHAWNKNLSFWKNLIL